MTVAIVKGCRSIKTTQCPDCLSPCKTVKTKQLAPSYREVTYECTRPACGHRFVAAITPVRTIVPSGLKAAEVTVAWCDVTGRCTRMDCPKMACTVIDGEIRVLCSDLACINSVRLR